MFRSNFAGSDRTVRFAIAGAVLLLTTKGALRYRAAAAAQDSAASTIAARHAEWSVDSLMSAATAAAGSQAFVAARPVAAPSRTSAKAPAPVAPPGMHPVLRGVLGGPPWSAIVEGLPSFPSAVVLRPGDTVAGLTVGRMTRDTVVLRGGGRTYFVTWAR